MNNWPQDDKRVAVHDSTRKHTYVVGENIYQSGTIRFQLKLLSFQNNHWILVGIVKADVVPKSPYSFSWAGAYGWVLGDTGQEYENGVRRENNNVKGQSKQG